MEDRGWKEAASLRYPLSSILHLRMSLALLASWRPWRNPLLRTTTIFGHSHPLNMQIPPGFGEEGNRGVYANRQ
jgi:hypothetical protein